MNFEDRVHEEVKKIQGGDLGYKDVAKRVGVPRAWRAVGNVLNKNYNPGIPCRGEEKKHRFLRGERNL